MGNHVKDPLVSILVSCYNVARFIEPFFKNIRKQTYTNFELIVVNDGSIDKTLDNIRYYSRGIKNIKIISHKQNLGLGAGRNTGLENATGKYIYFCDVDDIPKPDLIKNCVSCMENNIFDFLIFGFDVKYPDSQICNETIYFNEMRLNNPKEIKDNYVDSLLLSKHGNGFVWNKFYRRSFIEDKCLRFGDQKIQQDEVFNIKAILAATSIKVIPDALYVYNIFTTGNNGSRYIQDRFEIFINVRDHFEHLFKIWDIKSTKIDNYINKRFLGNILKCLDYDLSHLDCELTYKEKRHRFNQIVNHPYSLKSRSFFLYHKNNITFINKIYLLSFNSYELFRVINFLITTSTKLYKSIKK